MDYRGVYQDGVIKPEGDVSFPNGTPVEFHPVVDKQEEAILRADHLARNPPTADELTAGVKPLKGWQDFKKVWPDDEDVDDFIRSIRERK